LPSTISSRGLPLIADRTRLALFVAVMAVAVSVGACNVAATTTPTADPTVVSTGAAPAELPHSRHPEPLVRVVLEEPDVGFTLPIGWREVTLDELRLDADRLNPDSEANTRFFKQLSDGRLRTMAEGYTDDAVHVELEVSFDGSGQSVVDVMKVVAEDVSTIGVIESVEAGTSKAPIGTAFWFRYVLKLIGDSTTALPAHLMVYVVPIRTSGSLVLQSIGVQTDLSHRTMLADIVSSIDLDSGLTWPGEGGPRHGQIEGTDLGFTYPGQFVPVPLDAYRRYLDRIIDHPAADRDEVKRLMEQIDAGVLRARLNSIRPVGWGRTIDIGIHPRDADMASAIARVTRESGAPVIESAEEVVLPAGESTRIRFPVEGSAIPAQDDVFIVRLDDGRTLSIAGRAVQDDDAFGEVLESFAESVRR
jgi:hypothetical protein